MNKTTKIKSGVLLLSLYTIHLSIGVFCFVAVAILIPNPTTMTVGVLIMFGTVTIVSALIYGSILTSNSDAYYRSVEEDAEQDC